MLGLFSSLQREYALQDTNGPQGCALSCDSKLLLLLWQAWFLSSKSNHCLVHPVGIPSKTPTALADWEMSPEMWAFSHFSDRRSNVFISPAGQLQSDATRAEIAHTSWIWWLLLLHHIICALCNQTVKRRRQWWGSHWIRVTGILFYKPILWCRRLQAVWP